MLDHKKQFGKSLNFWFTILLLANLSALITGCKPVVTLAPPPINQLPVLEIRIHTVSFNRENLSMIALWYTGNARNWNILSTYNGQLKSAAKLSIGDQIRIPSDLMVRSDLMPEFFVSEQAVKLNRIRKKKQSATAALERKSKTAGLSQPPEAELENEREASNQELEEFAKESSPDTQVSAPQTNQGPTATAAQDQLIENLLK